MRRPRNILLLLLLAIGAFFLLPERSSQKKEARQPNEPKQRTSRAWYRSLKIKEDTKTVSGEVLTTSGAPIAGAQVCATCVACRLKPDPICTPTDEEGRYQLALSQSLHTIDAQADGFLPAVDEVTPPQAFDFILENGGEQIKGVVRDQLGGIIAGAKIFVGSHDCEKVHGFFVETDAEGVFEARSPAGLLSLTVRADGYASHCARVFAPSDAVAIALFPEAVLRGQVITKEGEPVTDATVVVREVNEWKDRIVSGAQTDDQGRFIVGKIPPGRYKARLEDGWYGESEESVALRPLQIAGPITIVATKGGFTVTAKVGVSEDEPCSKGTATLTRDLPITQPIREGTVSFHGLSPGTYRVNINCEGYVPDEIWRLEIDRDRTDLFWKVARGELLRGTVVDSTGTPMPGALVCSTTREIQGFEQARAHSDRNGAFEMRLEEGPHHLDVFSGRRGCENLHHREVSQKKVLIKTGESPSPVRLIAKRPGAIQGRAIDQNGPIANASVMCTGDGRRRWNAHGLTDKQGRFLFEPLEPGRFNLKVYRDLVMQVPWLLVGADTTTIKIPCIKTVDVPEGTTVEVLLEAQPFEEGKITGRVTAADGTPLPEELVEVGPEPYGCIQYWRGPQQLTDADGRFTFDRLDRSKTYCVSVFRPSGVFVEKRKVRVGDHVSLVLPEGGRIAGQVLDPDGRPTARFTISMRGSQYEERFLRPDGRFSFSDLVAGDYEVAASTPDRLTARERVSLRAGDQKEIVLRLQRTVTVRVRVVDAITSEPVQGIGVRSRWRLGRSGWGRSSETDAEGWAIFEKKGDWDASIPPGPISIRAPDSYDYYGCNHEYVVSGTSFTTTIPIVVSDLPRQKKDRFGFEVANRYAPHDPNHFPLVVKRVDQHAASAGLKEGDVIIALNGTPLVGPSHSLFWGLLHVATVAELDLADGRRLTLREH